MLNDTPMQTTTLTLFQFTSLADKLWAFAQMGLAPGRLQGAEGLRFARLLGSGAVNGFSIWPDFSRYALLSVWDDEAAADAFFAGHPVFQAYRRRAATLQTVYLRATAFHGQWDGQTPFVASAAFDPAKPAAVITRATLYPRHLWAFWRRVMPVSRNLDGRPGLRFAVGIGELPLVQLATFSLWDSGKSMLEYAYRGALHADVIRQTRENGWYREELFARFEPYRVEGSGFFKL